KKLKGFFDKAGKEAETEEVEEKVLVEEEIKEPKEITKEKERPKKKSKSKKETKEGKVEEEKPKKKRSILKKITKKHISEKSLDSILWELELALLENDVAKEVTESITADTREILLETDLKRGDTAENAITSSLKAAIENTLDVGDLNIIEKIKENEERPTLILFVGFNGSGKTMTIGKFAQMLQSQGITVVMAAGDTFRAAAIEQLDIHAKVLKVPIIKQQRGSDAAAVIYDAVEHAKAKGIDVVLGDTAGRSHADSNLMDELKKIVRVNNPDITIFVGDSLTGNDASEQAKSFNDAVGIDASVLTKADCDVKGGACISISHMTGKPIIYLGTGQGYGDIEEFNPEWFVGKVFE
ncbi:MAG: signal recognition particle-docking protein FtsY, partial [archaeon]|nr:signal recognition particle-docking protein FtsY [archaeon]